MSVIYLLSSLPMLNFDTVPTLSPSKFDELCRDQLGKADADVVHALLHDEPSDHPFARNWNDKDTILRNAVSRHRAQLKNSDPSQWLRDTRGCDRQIEVGVENAFQFPDPLKRERALDKIRWQTIEDLQGPDPLCVNNIFGYALKLIILTRWQQRHDDQGLARFDKLTQVPITLDSTP